MTETTLQPAAETALQPTAETALQTTQQPLGKRPSPFVHLDNGNLSGTLLDGIKVGEARLTAFEMKPCSAGDMFDAEQSASPEHYLAYRGALIARQLVRLGDLNGPIDFSLIRTLSPRDITLLISALDAVEEVEKKASSV